MNTKCSNCGSQIIIESETDFVVCSYCSSTLYIKYNSSHKSFYFSPITTEKRAESLLFEDLKRLGLFDSNISSRKKIFLPFMKKGESLDIFPLFNPHPSFFSSYRFPPDTPFFFSEKTKEWGEVAPVDDETFILSKRDEKENLAIYYLPFYEFTLGLPENKLKFYIDALNGKVLFEPILSSISKNQVNKVLSFLFIYFIFFAFLSFLLKPPLLSFVMTLAISIIISPYVVQFVLRKFN